MSVPPRPLTGVLAALIAVPFLLRLPLIPQRGFNPDELEHVHFAWRLSQGKLPYLDFFDHHTPFLHFLLAPLFRFYSVAASGDDAVAFLFLARRLIWLCAAAILLGTFLLARRWRNERVAWAGTLLLANVGTFLAKSFEIRPDVPASALVVAALAFGLAGWRRAWQGAPRAAALLFASGVLLGSAVMFTQKALFLGPGIALAWTLMLASPGAPAGRGSRLLGLVAQAVGFALPVALTLGYFWSRGALRAFYECNVAVNARWPGLGPRAFVLEFLKDDPAFVALAALGLAGAAAACFGREAIARGEPLVALALLSPVASLLVHPAVTFHYFLLFLPQAALYAGAALVALSDRLAAASRRVSGSAVLAALAIALSIQPALRLRATFSRGNWSTLQGIRWVLRNTTPWDTTFDGFSGLGVFRPQAFYHPFQHWHTLAIQTEAQRVSILRGLETGAATPKLVFWDHDLQDGVTPEIKAFLERHYVPIGLDPIRVRPFDNGLGWWSDEGPRALGWVEGKERSPHVFFGDGWREPAVEDGLACRGSRTRQSALVVPMRQPRDCRIAFRAKAVEGAPFAVELIVNGSSAGALEVAGRWQDAAYAVPQRLLRPGFNELRLRYSRHGAAADTRLEWAVESLTITRSPPAER